MFIVQSRLTCVSPWQNESEEKHEGVAKLEYERICKLLTAREIRLVKTTQVEIHHSYPSDRKR